MAGRIIDLDRSDTTLSGPIVLDANVVIDRLFASFGSGHPRNALRAGMFFQMLHAAGEQAILTPTAYSEVLHAAVKVIYREGRSTHQSTLSAHLGRNGGFSWLDLYKLAPSILQEQSSVLHEFRERLLADNIVLLDPADLVMSSDTQRYALALPDYVARFGLDTSDATILFEASRIGIYSVASFDRDMRRAVADFDIYTWLDAK